MHRAAPPAGWFSGRVSAGQQARRGGHHVVRVGGHALVGGRAHNAHQLGPHVRHVHLQLLQACPSLTLVLVLLGLATLKVR